MNAFLLSFGVIFIAELGDKSQLMALAFATRFPALSVLVAITIATAVVHLGSVALGATVGAVLPTNVVRSWRAWRFSARRVDAPGRCPRGRGRGAIEARCDPLRDRHRRDGILPRRARGQDDARDRDPRDERGAFGTWLGSTAGMVAADAIAIGIGKLLGANLPERAIRIGAAVAFVVFGVILIWQGVAH